MPVYICERCLKEFSQKSHYNIHLKRKNPCQNNKGKIEEVIEKMVNEKIDNTLNEKLIERNENINNTSLSLNNMNSLDQFYTKEHISEECINTLKKYISFNDYDYILEPSAGTGSFYKLLPKNKRIGLDLEPKFNGILKMDYFDFIPKKNKKYIVIGNPPFGKISSLAIKFFNKSANFADVIAFIIPRTFKRVSIQNKLNLNFKLVYNNDLPVKPCCFTPNMDAKCCFQIWIKDKCKQNIIRYDKTHPDFEFLKLGPKDNKKQPTPPSGADFVMKAYGSNCGELKCDNLQILRPKSWHWIKSNINLEKLKSRFKSLDYSISKDTVRQDSIGQQEVIYLYKYKYS